MSPLLSVAAAVAAGLLGAMGLGGGGILLLALVCSGVGQLAAQGINLVFILPVGMTGLLLHRRSGLAELSAAWPAALGGVPGVLLGSLLAQRIDEATLTRVFGFFIIAVAAREFMLGISSLRRDGLSFFRR